MKVSIGLANFNPGNLRPSAQKWLGELSPDPRGYCVFVTMVYGVRAMAINLRNYQVRHKLYTVRSIIMRWAPPTDNNDTESYITDVSKRTGFAPDAWIDTRNVVTLTELCAAIAWHENGTPVSNDDLDAGVALALAAIP